MRRSALSNLCWGFMLAALCASALAGALALAMAQGGNDAEGTDSAGTIRILPMPARVDSGGVVTVDIWLENVRDYYGIDARLHFDTARLQATSNRVTPSWDVFDENNHFFVKNQIDNATGEIWYAVTNVSPAEPFTGSGRICSITFLGTEDGAAVLDFYYVKGSTIDGNPLYPAQADGAILVGPAYLLYLPCVQAGP